MVAIILFSTAILSSFSTLATCLNFGVHYNKHLEFQKVLNETPPLTLGEVSFYIASREVSQVLFGVKVKYIEEPEFKYDNTPVIKVCPILFIGTINNSWLQVESNYSVKLPTNNEKIGEHLKEVEQNANDFLAKLNHTLKINIIPTAIETHFENKDAFEVIT